MAYNPELKSWELRKVGERVACLKYRMKGLDVSFETDKGEMRRCKTELRVLNERLKLSEWYENARRQREENRGIN